MSKRNGNLFVSNSLSKYKPSLWRKLILSLLIIDLVLFQWWLNTGEKSSPGVLGLATDLEPEKVIAVVNAVRIKEQLPSLNTNPLLMAAAQDKIDDMFTFGYWEHTSPSKRTVWKMILDRGYNYQFAGENLAKNFQKVDELVDAWVESEPHKANILNTNFEDTGVAVGSGELNGEPAVLIVQLFGKKQPPTVESVSDLESPPLVFSASMLGFNPNRGWSGDQLLNTRNIAMYLAILLTIILGIDVYLSLRIKHKPKISAKYWTHVFLLFVIGAMWLFRNQAQSF